jgi:hypothetical protein
MMWSERRWPWSVEEESNLVDVRSVAGTLFPPPQENRYYLGCFHTNGKTVTQDISCPRGK